MTRIDFPSGSIGSFTEDQMSYGTSYLLPVADDPYGPFLWSTALTDPAVPVLERMLIASSSTSRAGRPRSRLPFRRWTHSESDRRDADASRPLLGERPVDQVFTFYDDPANLARFDAAAASDAARAGRAVPPQVGSIFEVSLRHWAGTAVLARAPGGAGRERALRRRDHLRSNGALSPLAHLHAGGSRDMDR